MAEDTLVDFAVVVFREEGQWQVCSLPHKAATELPALLHAVRQQPSEGPTFAICSYGDDVRLMISDATAAGDWPVAREALDLVDEPQPEDDEAAAPAGDLDIFADLGIDSMELVAVCSDLEAYPDEMLGQVAARIGFGPQFESVVDDDLT